jgi:hypothetical protein
VEPIDYAANGRRLLQRIKDYAKNQNWVDLTFNYKLMCVCVYIKLKLQY